MELNFTNLFVNIFPIFFILMVCGDLTIVGCYESETHRRRQERQSEGRFIRSVEEIHAPTPTREESVMIESISYSDADRLRDLDAELKRQAKMFKTSNILSSLLQDYDSRLRPKFGEEPVDVDVTLHVDSLGPISETEMSFRVDLAFRQYWMDKRLEFAGRSNESITLSHEFLHKIWLPDTYFPESLSADKHSVMVPNILLRLSPDGQVLYSCRVTVVAKCPMQLEYFPLDTQKCSLIIEAYGYTARDLKLRWKEDFSDDPQPAVQVGSGIELSQFRYMSYQTDSYELAFSTGNFSDLEVIFVFKRTLLYFVLQSYLPATLIVNLSFVSFWVDPSSIPARVNLAITTVLTMITLMGTVNSQLPKVSNIKALDVYFGMCFIYVFAALIEFSVVCYLHKGSKRRAAERAKAKEKSTAVVKKEKEQPDEHYVRLLQEVDNLTQGASIPRTGLNPPSFEDRLMMNASHGAPYNHIPVQSQQGTRRVIQNAPIYDYSEAAAANTKPAITEPKIKAHCCDGIDVLRIDNCSRVIFPSTFLILNLIYWGAYTNIMNSMGNNEEVSSK